MSLIRTSFDWTFRALRSGIIVAQKTVHNIQTTAGLTAFASAFQGSYTPPIYLAIDSEYASGAANHSIGANKVTLNAQIHQTGDTQIIASLGTANEETLTFTSVTANGPNWDYNLSGTATKAHSTSEIAVRVPRASDTVSTFVSEEEYDSTNAANKRKASTGGYSPGSAQWTMQFYYLATEAPFYIARAGLLDSDTVGAGSLHNEVVVGFDHTALTDDLEIDVTLTLSNV